jgi:hypothetical protein
MGAVSAAMLFTARCARGAEDAENFDYEFVE